jgi:hypothetical protein
MATMSAEVSFDRALAAVADGESVDWEALERLPRDAADRQRVRCLRLLAEIGEVHRSTIDPLEGATAPSPVGPTPVAPTPVLPSVARPMEGTERRAPRAVPAVKLQTNMTDTIDDASGPKNAARWGRYRLVEKVGVGGFGQVYRAWDPDLECEVAIKLLHAHIANDRAGERLRQEGRALAKIRQTNVVRVLGVEVHEGRAALCMEFVRGETLEELVRSRGSCNAKEAMIFGEDVCRALTAVHRAGYLHRDVKAKNVMREQAGRIVLMDFGTGRQDQPDRPGGSDLTGTPIYMAPEVLEGRPASARSDVYSVGVLLFFLVTGSHPVQARSTSELKTAHRQGRRRLLSELRSDLPASFVELVERALAPNAHDRFPSAAAMLEALSRALNKQDEVSWRVKWARRLAIGVPGAIAGFVALGAFTSAAFNNTLERVGFTSETIVDRTVFGLKSVVLPLAFLLFGWFLFAVLQAARDLIVGLSARARAIDSRVSAWLAPALRNPAMLAGAILLAAGATLVLAWWRFLPLLDAMMGSASIRPAEVLAVLSPRYESYQDEYRQVFSWMFIGTAAAIATVSRIAARQRVVLSTAVVVGIVMLLCLQLGSMTIAYRLLIQNKGFEPVKWSGQPCFHIGERQDQVLVFCPGAPPPRSQLVPRRDVQPDPSRRGESVFTGLADSRSSTR